MDTGIELDMRIVEFTEQVGFTVNEDRQPGTPKSVGYTKEQSIKIFVRKVINAHLASGSESTIIQMAVGYSLFKGFLIT